MKTVAWRLRSPALISFLLFNLVFALLIGIREAGGLQSAELLAYDFGMRTKPSKEIDDRVVLVGYTETDIHALGYPASDEVLARILEHLTRYRARAIGVDIYRDIPVPPGTDRLDDILRKNRDIVWVTKLGNEASRVLPPKVLVNTDQVGFNDMVDDPGGKMRRGLLFMDDGKDSYTSFSLQLALRYLQPLGIGLQPDQQNRNFVRLGNTTIPPLLKDDGGYVNADDAGYQFLLDYKGMPNRFRHFSFSELLTGKVPPALIQDRIVIVGAMANSINDFFYTPFSEGEGMGQRIYGIELHGFNASQLVRFAVDGDKPIKTFDNNAEWAWIWLWALLGAATGFFARALWQFAVTAVAALATLALVYYSAFMAGWWIPVIPPAIGYVVSAAVIASFMASQLHLKNKFIRSTFGRYMSEAVVKELLESPDGLQLGGKSLDVTVMFTDLRGFTALSEVLPPQAVIGMLNDYLKEMTEIVFRYQGTINEFMGDGILILFGAPTMRPDDADRAIACAIEMQLAMEKVNAVNRAKELPELEMGIGINTGHVVAGNLGSDMRAKYTVIGSNVNLAARVESFTVGGQILVTKSTLAALTCEVLLGGEFSTSFKGFREPITIYEINGIEGNYNLRLHGMDDAPQPLEQELQIRYEMLDGKQSSGKTLEGKLTHLAKRTALLVSAMPLSVRTNIKVYCGNSDAPAYAKVMKLNGEVCEIRFTSIPDELRSIFEEHAPG